MADIPPFYSVVSEETSFKRILSPTGEEALEVEVETVIRSLAGVTDTRCQSFALSGEPASKLIGALQTITENMNNLVEKSTEEAQKRYNDLAAQEEATDESTEAESEEEESPTPEVAAAIDNE
jgi:hypothetical protein